MSQENVKSCFTSLRALRELNNKVFERATINCGFTEINFLLALAFQRELNSIDNSGDTQAFHPTILLRNVPIYPSRDIHCEVVSTAPYVVLKNIGMDYGLIIDGSMAGAIVSNATYGPNRDYQYTSGMSLFSIWMDQPRKVLEGISFENNRRYFAGLEDAGFDPMSHFNRAQKCLLSQEPDVVSTGITGILFRMCEECGYPINRARFIYGNKQRRLQTLERRKQQQLE